jgi:phosphate butyryltransferase
VQNEIDNNIININNKMITKLDDVLALAKSRGKKRLVAAYANDSHTIGAVSAAIDAGIVDATLVGDIDTIKKVCAEEGIDVNKFELVQEADETKAGVKAVELINEGKGNLLMKGLLSTDKYMRAILAKDKGLMPGKKNDMLTHMAVFEVPAYHKLLIASDVAIIPTPDMKQKQAILSYLISTAKSLEIANPKVALIAATEQVSVGMPACSEAAIISMMNNRGQIKGAIVDGPLALDVAIDKESAEIKKLKGEVAGDADCLLFPNIESGNVFYKACTKFAGAELACMVVGAKVPCILSSRGDSMKTKLYSIALAALSAK